MCGLAGFVTFAPFAEPAQARSALVRMTRAIAHRGPDGEGHWLDSEQGVALGHRRLAILDLSPAGAQPMFSACGRFVLAFNGEIYNHPALRRTLEAAGAAPDWRGHSDTETLLAMIARHGLDRALREACGMFAIALWDRRDRTLSLARDRMGEKPLYLMRPQPSDAQEPGGHPAGWRFGSELRALIAHPATAPAIDPVAVAAYLRLGHVPDHLCILQGVEKVMPGAIVTLRAGDDPRHRRYDHSEALFGRAGTPSDPLHTDPGQAADRLETVLREVVDEHMLSDVPLGCFLSGGVDSSLVAALMQAGSNRQIHSFSIGFDDPRFNEAPHAAAVARHLGTAHTEFILRQDDALDLIPDLPAIYDEPFADSSQIPTTLLCRAARAHVSVALTGDGGDEIFGGYNRHVRGPALWATLARLPGPLRPLAAGSVRGLARLGLRHETAMRRATGALGLPLTTLDTLPRLARVLEGAGDAEAFYQTFVSVMTRPEQMLSDKTPRPSPPDPRARAAHEIGPGLDMAEWMMARDSTGYLPGDILVKLDRAAMSVALETRAPFLDARVMAEARRSPARLHVDARTGKKLLRAVLYRHVPQALIERPKQGFAMPLDDWLRGALRDWGAALIGDGALAATLGLDTRALQTLWDAHQSRHASHGREIWTLLMLMLWARSLARLLEQSLDQSPARMMPPGRPVQAAPAMQPGCTGQPDTPQ